MNHAHIRTDYDSNETLPKFPNWVRQAIGFGSIIIAISTAYYSLKSDVRDVSTRYEQRGLRLDEVEKRTDKMGQDLSDIKGDMRYVRQMIENGGVHPR